MTSDEAVLDACADVCQSAVFQNNTPFDLAVLNRNIMIDAGKGADIAVFDNRIFADDGRVAYHILCLLLTHSALQQAKDDDDRHNQQQQRP